MSCDRNSKRLFLYPAVVASITDCSSRRQYTYACLGDTSYLPCPRKFGRDILTVLRKGVRHLSRLDTSTILRRPFSIRINFVLLRLYKTTTR